MDIKIVLEHNALHYGIYITDDLENVLRQVNFEMSGAKDKWI